METKTFIIKNGTAYTLRHAMERKIEFQNVCYNRK